MERSVAPVDISYKDLVSWYKYSAIGKTAHIEKRLELANVL